MENTNKNNIDRKWIAKITCPLCDEKHPIIWPYASFPLPTETMKFECPKEKGTIVFPNAVTVWAELLFSQSHLISAEPIIVERFYG